MHNNNFKYLLEVFQLQKMPSVVSWSLDPLLYASVPTQVSQSILDITVVRGIYICAFILSLTYTLVHKQLIQVFARYSSIESKSKQVVVLHHAVEFLVLSISFPFFTYYMIKICFQTHELNESFLSKNLKPIAILCAAFMTMYMMELASRYDDIRPMTLFHHVLSIMDGGLIFLFPSTIMIKTGTILVYFICFEMLTFAGLFMYRIFPQSKMTPKVILGGMIMFGGTRPLQLLWVGGAVVGTWGNEHFVLWQAITQVTVALVLTVLQVWTITIHYGIWKRCQRRISSRIAEESKRVGGTDDDKSILRTKRGILAENSDTSSISNDLENQQTSAVVPGKHHHHQQQQERGQEQDEDQNE